MAKTKKPVIEKPKRYREKELGFQRYPHITLLLSSGRTRRQLLGKRLSWTIKEDGQNVTIWFKKHKYSKIPTSDIIISSHNLETAADDIRTKVEATPEYEKVLELISANPTFRVVAELCSKGRSITGIKTYDRDQLIIVDIYDAAIKNFLNYTAVYQYCYHVGLPVVKLFAETRHRTLKDLIKYAYHCLEVCDAPKDYGKDEGMVVKTFDEEKEYIMAKVKLDVPEPVERKVQEGKPVLPQIPENEIMGAISHTEADFGLTGEPAHDMPLIAKAVSEECHKHLYSSRGNLFVFYKEYMEKHHK